MRVVNKTDHPTEEVRRLVRLGMKELDGLKKTTITVASAPKHSTGYAQWSPSWHIHIRLGPAKSFPQPGWIRHRGGELNGDWKDWQEALVALAAHEGRHLDLAFNSPTWPMPNSQAIERSCAAWEHKVLKDYRERQD